MRRSDLHANAKNRGSFPNASLRVFHNCYISDSPTTSHTIGQHGDERRADAAAIRSAHEQHSLCAKDNNNNRQLLCPTNILPGRRHLQTSPRCPPDPRSALQLRLDKLPRARTPPTPRLRLSLHIFYPLGLFALIKRRLHECACSPNRTRSRSSCNRRWRTHLS